MTFSQPTPGLGQVHISKWNVLTRVFPGPGHHCTWTLWNKPLRYFHPGIMFNYDLSSWNKLLSMHCLLLCMSLPFTTADYIIDDTSSNITYAPSSGTGDWGRGSLTSPLDLLSDRNSSSEVIDYTRLYGNTLWATERIDIDRFHGAYFARLRTCEYTFDAQLPHITDYAIDSEYNGSGPSSQMEIHFSGTRTFSISQFIF